jgi:hypothetical protein
MQTPGVGLSCKVRSFNSVDFPAPDGPVRKWKEPAAK